MIATTYDDIHEIHTASTSDLIERFKKYGEIVHTIKRGKDFAKIGKIKGDDVFVVFYPDGIFDRFDGIQIEYRSGWKGPGVLEIAKSKSTIIKEDAKTTPKISKDVPNEIKISAAKKRSAKKNEAVNAWFSLLGVENPKAKKPASKKAKSTSKH